MKSKLLFALLSAVIAFGLWVYVVTVVSPESEATFYNVPVVLSNESVLNDKGLMVVSDGNPTITLRLSGNRSDLNSLKSSDITVLADLSKINEAGEQILNYTVSFPGEFAANAFEILSRNPDRITMEIVEWATKEVNVLADFIGSVPADYIDYRTAAVLSHEKVTITGPKSVIDEIDKAVISVNLNDRKETFSQSYRYTLCDASGNPVDAAQVKTNVSEVSVTVKIQRVKEIKLDVELKYGGGVTEETTQKVLSAMSIWVAGSDKRLEELEKTLTNGTLILETIDLSTVTTDALDKTYSIKLPEGVDNVSGIDEVTLTITFPGVESTVIKVTAIQALNLPAGMTVTFGTQVLPVTVRGTAAQIAKITAEDITVSVDFTGVTIGKSNIEPKISIDSEFDQVGVFGTYEVVASVTELTAQPEGNT